MCMTITGVLVGVSGVAFLLFGLGSLGAMVAHVVSGAALTIVGIAFLVHGAGMCSMCKSGCEEHMSKGKEKM